MKSCRLPLASGWEHEQQTGVGALRMVHHIKIREEFFIPITAGKKLFELRKNDRGYQCGDLIRFTVIRDQDKVVTEDRQLYEITYVISGWGLKNGYVAFGIRPLSMPPKKGEEDD